VQKLFGMSALKASQWHWLMVIGYRIAICLPFFALAAMPTANASQCSHVYLTSLADWPSHRVNLSEAVDQRRNEELAKGPYDIEDRGKLAASRDYQNQLDQVRSGLFKTTDPGRYESVFYPLMGSDITLPLRIFPNVKTIVTIDQVPFVRREPGKEISLGIHDPIVGPWRAAIDIQRDGQVAPRILGALLSEFPKAQILDITLYDGPSERTENQTPPTSAVVHFDLHDGVGIRQLIYIHHSLPSLSRKSPPDQKISDLVSAHHPQVAVLKASMGIAKYTQLENLVLENVKAQRGLILEGLAEDIRAVGGGPEGRTPEFSPEFQETKRPNQPTIKTLPNLHPGGKSYIIPNIPFGYDAGVLVTDFNDRK
jgi:hypothetical protein